MCSGALHTGEIWPKCNPSIVRWRGLEKKGPRLSAQILLALLQCRGLTWRYEHITITCLHTYTLDNRYTPILTRMNWKPCRVSALCFNVSHSNSYIRFMLYIHFQYGLIVPPYILKKIHLGQAKFIHIRGKCLSRFISSIRPQHHTPMCRRRPLL